MNIINDNSTFKIYEPTWIGLLQIKVASIKNINELIDWTTNLKQNNSHLPDNIIRLLSKYESLAQQKDPLFKEYATEEAKLILFKDYLLELTMKFFPRDLDESLRQKYIAKFTDAIPNFFDEWSYDVNFREGDNSLIMLFVFLNGNMNAYDNKTLEKIFQIIDIGLVDPNEIVQADLVRGLLINFVRAGLEDSKYIKYMPGNTAIFCTKISSIWRGEKIS